MMIKIAGEKKYPVPTSHINGQVQSPAIPALAPMGDFIGHLSRVKTASAVGSEA